MTSAPESWTVAATADQVAVLRAEVTAYAQRVGVARGRLDDVRLAVSEAATNAVLHAYREGRGGDVRLVACAEPGRLVVVVRDYGCGMRPRADSPGLGVGLAAIGHLATHFNVEAPDGDGTRLRMQFPR
jgi:anti-sigma regulatory factor (Ser/Thr protein kinase)